MKTVLRSGGPLFVQCHSLLASQSALHRIYRRHFAHRDTLKRLKRELGYGKKKHCGPKRGQMGRAPGWLQQVPFIVSI